MILLPCHVTKYFFQASKELNNGNIRLYTKYVNKTDSSRSSCGSGYWSSRSKSEGNRYNMLT